MRYLMASMILALILLSGCGYSKDPTKNPDKAWKSLAESNMKRPEYVMKYHFSNSGDIQEMINLWYFIRDETPGYFNSNRTIIGPGTDYFCYENTDECVCRLVPQPSETLTAPKIELCEVGKTIDRAKLLTTTLINAMLLEKMKDFTKLKYDGECFEGIIEQETFRHHYRACYKNRILEHYSYVLEAIGATGGYFESYNLNDFKSLDKEGVLYPGSDA